jgi:DNA-binding transcriptional ArsR family regulator
MAERKTGGQDKAAFAYDGLDRVLHERARLGILTSLAANAEPLSFGDLKRLCDLTDGNLSRHLKILTEESLIAIDKRFEDNRPLTTVSMTDQGRRRYLDYLAVLEQVVRDAGAVRKAAKRPTKTVRLSPS